MGRSRGGRGWNWGLADFGEGTFTTFRTRRAAFLAAGFATRYTRRRLGDGSYQYTSEEGSEAYVGRVNALVAAGLVCDGTRPVREFLVILNEENKEVRRVEVTGRGEAFIQTCWTGMERKVRDGYSVVLRRIHRGV